MLIAAASILVGGCSSGSNAKPLTHPVRVTAQDDGTPVWAFVDENGLQSYAQTRELTGAAYGEQFAHQVQEDHGAIDLAGAADVLVVAQDSMDVGQNVNVAICGITSSLNESTYWTFCSELHGL